MINFKTKVTMKVTYDQYEIDLKESLKDLGYTWSSQNPEDFSKWGILSMNQDSWGGMVCVNHDQFAHRIKESVYIEEYNPQLFLALASMRDGEEIHVGEYMKQTKGGSQIVKITSVDDNEDNSFGGFSSNYLKDYWRKASVDELIQYFNSPGISGKGRKPLKEKVQKESDWRNYNTTGESFEIKLSKEYLGLKESDDKLNYELDWEFIEGLAKRMQTEKYPPYNWKKPIEKEKLKQAMLRHMVEVMKGNYEDDGDEFGHTFALAANAMMLFHQLKNHK